MTKHRHILPKNYDFGSIKSESEFSDQDFLNGNQNKCIILTFRCHFYLPDSYNDLLGVKFYFVTIKTGLIGFGPKINIFSFFKL